MGFTKRNRACEDVKNGASIICYQSFVEVQDIDDVDLVMEGCLDDDNDCMWLSSDCTSPSSFFEEDTWSTAPFHPSYDDWLVKDEILHYGLLSSEAASKATDLEEFGVTDDDNEYMRLPSNCISPSSFLEEHRLFATPFYPSEDDWLVKDEVLQKGLFSEAASEAADLEEFNATDDDNECMWLSSECMSPSSFFEEHRLFADPFYPSDDDWLVKDEVLQYGLSPKIASKVADLEEFSVTDDDNECMWLSSDCISPSSFFEEYRLFAAPFYPSDDDWLEKDKVLQYGLSPEAVDLEEFTATDNDNESIWLSSNCMSPSSFFEEHRLFAGPFYPSEDDWLVKDEVLQYGLSSEAMSEAAYLKEFSAINDDNECMWLSSDCISPSSFFEENRLFAAPFYPSDDDWLVKDEVLQYDLSSEAMSEATDLEEIDATDDNNECMWLCSDCMSSSSFFEEHRSFVAPFYPSDDDWLVKDEVLQYDLSSEAMSEATDLEEIDATDDNNECMWLCSDRMSSSSFFEEHRSFVAPFHPSNDDWLVKDEVLQYVLSSEAGSEAIDLEECSAAEDDDEPLFWPFDRELGWSSDEAWTCFSMSPRKEMVQFYDQETKRKACV